MKGPRQRHRLVAAVLVTAFALTATAAVPADGPLGQGLVRPGDGKPVTLATGAPALHVVFFAIWCPPCVDELTRLAELEVRWDERGYRLVLIAVQHRHTAERLEEFRLESETPGELLFDQRGTAREASKVSDLPTHLIFDASGREVLRAASFDEGVAEKVASLLGGERSGGGR